MNNQPTTVYDTYKQFFIKYERFDKKLNRKVETDYMLVPGRVKWFRDENGKAGSIETTFSALGALTIATARVSIDGVLVATGSATLQSFNGRDIEKTETAAVGRALAFAGYGTQFSGDDINDEDYLSDNPLQLGDEKQYLTNQKLAAKLYRKWTDTDGLSKQDILSALGNVSVLSDFKGTTEEAEAAIKAFVDSKVAPDSVETPTPSPDEQPIPKAQAPAPAEPKQTGKQFTHRGGLTPDVSNRIGLDDIDSERMALAERGEAVRLARIVERDTSHQQAWTVLVHHDSGLLRYTMFKDTLDELRLNHKWLNDLFIKDFDINAPSIYPIEFSQPAWVQLGVSKNSKTKKLYPVIKNIHITDEQADAMLQTIASGKQPAIDIQSIYARTQGGKP